MLTPRSYYASYKQHGTDTGRWSGDFQQTPRVVPDEPNIRNCVRAPEGTTLLEMDGSQLELRLIAWRSREPTLLRLYQEGKDVHEFSGRMLFGIPAGPLPKIARQTGKTCNFGLGYEAGPDTLAEIMLLNLKDDDIARIKDLLKVGSLEDCATVLHRQWHSTFPGIRQWHRREKVSILRYGKAVAPHGREKHLPRVFSRDEHERAKALREGINHIIQSPASDLTILSGVLATPRLYDMTWAQGGPWSVHDSLLYVVYTQHLMHAARWLKECFEVHAVKGFDEWFDVRFDVPLLADVKSGERWGALTELSVA